MLCVALSDIAAELLPDEQTAYSQFQILLNIYQDFTTMIIRTLDAADLMQKTASII